MDLDGKEEDGEGTGCLGDENEEHWVGTLNGEYLDKKTLDRLELLF